MDSPQRRELEVSFGAVQAASKLSQHIINSTNKGVVEKEDLSPVTVADFAIQALLAATIKAAFPGDRIVGEENATQLRADPVLREHVFSLLKWVVSNEKQIDGPDGWMVPGSPEQMCDLIDECGTSSPSTSGRTWVFDPIDGTKTYVRGELYAINVALLEDGQQLAGVVGCPNLALDAKAPLVNADISPSGCIIFAVKGHGAYIRPLDGKTEDIVPRRLEHQTSQGEVRLVTCATLNDSSLPGVNEAVASRTGAQFPGCDLLPWVLRWAVLAVGLGNTTVWVYKRRDRRAKAWDHAGAMLLFEEAGGHITDVHGKPIDLTAGRTMTENFGFVAATKELHGRVLQTVHDVLREKGHTSHLEG